MRTVIYRYLIADTVHIIQHDKTRPGSVSIANHLASVAEIHTTYNKHDVKSTWQLHTYDNYYSPIINYWTISLIIIAWMNVENRTQFTQVMIKTSIVSFDSQCRFDRFMYRGVSIFSVSYIMVFGCAISWWSEGISTNPNPRLLQTTPASTSSKKSSQTVPQIPSNLIIQLL